MSLRFGEDAQRSAEEERENQDHDYLYDAAFLGLEEDDNRCH